MLILFKITVKKRWDKNDYKINEQPGYSFLQMS